MITDVWPLFGLRLRTPRLELRLPGLGELAELAQLAAAGVHDPAVMPFGVPWTDAEPDVRARATAQWHWQQWGTWTPERWQLSFVALAGRTVVGTQELGAQDFADLREVNTGSWLGLAHHGQGYGTEMRAAVLELAFAGLGAEWATSEAFEDNHASYRVSRKLGYTDDGLGLHRVRGKVVKGRRLRLDREAWAAHRAVPVEIDGLAACLPRFGLPAA